MQLEGFDMVLDLERSEGPYIYDSKSGKYYLDFFTFFASNPIGMNHPKVRDEDFLQKIQDVAIHKPSNSDIYTREMAEFLNTFSRVAIPDKLPYAFFVSGGSLAVENALKTAFDWKVQKNFQKGYRQEKGHKILHLDQAFHGRSGYTMSLTNTDPNKVAYFPKFDWPRITNPKITFPLEGENLRHVEEQEERAINQAIRYFEQYKDDIAAIILEPIQGEGGDNHFRPEFHQRLRKLADDYEALLIHDEVQTGVGLTGRFWAHEHFVTPDIMAFGKKSQVCGILAGKRLDEVETNVFHVPSRINSTWGGNLVDMVRFQRYLEIIESDGLVDHVAGTGKQLLDKLSQFAGRHEEISNPRGRGFMCAFDLASPELRKVVIDKAFQYGLLILPCGTHSLRFRPPLIATEQHIDEGLDILERALGEAREERTGLRQEALRA